MPSYFCISVTWLGDRCHALNASGQHEWPPSPYRLFQAITAGGLRNQPESQQCQARRRVLSWMEQLPAAHIVTPNAKKLPGYMGFVPNNDEFLPNDRNTHLTPKPVRPTVFTNNERTSVHYVWEWHENASTPARDDVQDAVRSLTTLGWGIDPAFANARWLSEDERAKLQGMSWQPMSQNMSGGVSLRTPVPGSLAELEKIHKQRQSTLTEQDGQHFYASISKPDEYKVVAYAQNGLGIANAPHAMFRLQLPGGRDESFSVRAEQLVTVAAMTRHAAIGQMKRDAEELLPASAPFYVAGHREDKAESNERFAYVPLPSIGHPHTDGNIRRVMILGPRGGGKNPMRWATAHLHMKPLIREGSSEAVAELVHFLSDSVTTHYTEESETWTSITPVLLPGHDEHDYSKAQQLFAKALSQAGYTNVVVEDVLLSKSPLSPNARHVREYFVPKHLERFPRWHVRIRFAASVKGPIVLGPGRFCGLGLFFADKG